MAKKAKKKAAKKSASKKSSTKKASAALKSAATTAKGAAKTKVSKAAKSAADAFLGKYVILKKSFAEAGDPFGGLETFPSVRAARIEEARPLEVAVAEMKFQELADIRRDPRVVSIAPSMPMHLIEPVNGTATATPTAAGNAWGIEAVGANQSVATGAGVVVAVLDTGIDASHPAFTGVSLTQKNFTSEAASDLHGHGTHCAGTIFGRDVGGFRIGVARGVSRAVIGKVLGAGGGSTESIASAIMWAVEEGAHVISMSLGIDFGGFVKRLIDAGFPPELATSRALEGYRTNVRLYDTLTAQVRARGMLGNGTVIVAAAGNESQREVDPDFEVTVAPPATADGIVSVAAIGQSSSSTNPFVLADFSNTGANVAAPGVNISSAKRGGGLISMNGTSMATPHVAGVAVLWAEQLMSLTGGRLVGDQLIAKLVGTARTLSGIDPMDVGAGLVKAP
jgi:subtilisin family serine protease